MKCLVTAPGRHWLPDERRVVDVCVWRQPGLDLGPEEVGRVVG